MKYLILLVAFAALATAGPSFPAVDWGSSEFMELGVFDGEDDRLVLDQHFHDESSFSVEAVVKPAGKQGYIFSQRDWDRHGMLLQYYPGSYQFFVDDVVLRAGARPDEQHYVAATYDGSTARLYVDGELVDSAESRLTWPEVNAVIGDRMTFNRQFKGEILALKVHKGAIPHDYINLVNQSLGKPRLLREKWRLEINNSRFKEIFPVMGDVDSDNSQEIVFVASDNVYCVDAKTGEIEWSVAGAEDKTAELVDLDADGTPEILHSTPGAAGRMHLRALDGDGSILWVSESVGGDGSPMFPIIAQDIDGDGYPAIYYATADAWPSPYREDEPYNGTLNLMDHEGNVLASQRIYRPCWGGLAMADADRDGSYEVYLGDRKAGYLGFPSQGLMAFDAGTLDLIWSRPDIQLSSPMPKIADVIVGGDFEIIAEHNIMKGPIVLDAGTGETILDYSDRMLPTHGSGTVADIDGDGNLEHIMSTGDPSTAPEDFAVFDLVEGVTEFRPELDSHVSWPPSVADITGDGKMEILVGAGDQRSLEGFPLIIYDDAYEEIERLDLEIGQLMPPRVFDIDNDDRNELVVSGIDGTLIAYDTRAAATQGVDTWRQYYGNHRLGAPVAGDYVIIQAPMDFDGVDDRLELEQSFSGDGFFVDAVVTPVDKHGYIISQRDWHKNGMLLQYYKGTIQLYSDDVRLGIAAESGETHRVVADLSDGILSLSVDGVEESVDAGVTWPDVPVIIGDRASNNRQFRGRIDSLSVGFLN